MQTKNVSQMQRIFAAADKSESLPLLVDNLKPADGSIIQDTSGAYIAKVSKCC